MKIWIYLVCFLILKSTSGITQNSPGQLNISVQTGDLLFCSSTSGELSNAIDRVTQTTKQTHFDHMGIIESVHDTLWVLHAAPGKGVCRELISQFLQPEGKVINVIAHRLKTIYAKSIPGAIKKANALLGEPYKFSYRLSDKGFYCSEYIFKIFAADSVFVLNPMTFKDPRTGQFLPAWVEYYGKLGIQIPEGEPGCNPNGLASSEKLDLLGMIKLVRAPIEVGPGLK